MGDIRTLLIFPRTVVTPPSGPPAPVIVPNLMPVALHAGSPMFSSLPLINIGVAPPKPLAAASLAAGSPILATPQIVVPSGIQATALAGGSPAFSAPSIAQTNNLSAGNLVAGAPIFGTSIFGGAGAAVTSAPLSAGSPAFGAPTITILAANFTAAVLSAGVPIFGTPMVGVAAIAFTATALAAGSPVFGTSAFNVASNPPVPLTAIALQAGSPVFGAAAFNQHDIPTPAVLSAGSPVLSTPILDVSFSAAVLAAGSPAFSAPAITQRYVVAAQALAAGSPVFSTPAVTWAGPATGLLHRWQMDAGSISGGVMTDLAGSANATITGTTVSAASPPGAFASSALSFDGASGQLNLAVNALPSGAFTVAFWAEMPDITFIPSDGNSPTFFNLNDTVGVDWMGLNLGSAIHGGDLGFARSAVASVVSTAKLITNNTWALIGFTYDGTSTYGIVINGTSKATASASIPTATGPSVIGCESNGKGHVKATLYQFCIYNHVLSSPEWTQLLDAV